MTIRRATITGTGSHAPQRVVPNRFFNDLYGKDIDTFLREQRNIRERRWMEKDQRTSDLILPAAQQALTAARLNASEVDLIIVATDTPDYLSPSTAAVVSHRLGATKAGTFDINTACAGFVTALDTAAKAIVADRYIRNVLVVGAYAMSKWLNMADYKIASLFADGAAAAVLQPGDEGGVLASHLWTDGQYHDAMGIYAGGSARPINHEVVENREHLLAFPKRIPPETNGIHWPRLAQLVLDRVHKAPTDVQHYFLTQFNVQSIYETMDRLKVPRERAPLIMDRFGYTGSASIGMALDESVRTGRLKKGDLCLFIGSGGGMSMATLALEWSHDT